MAPNLDRLRKVLVTLLIDFSEEEIIGELDQIPSNYKQLNRKHLGLMPQMETKVFIEVKGVPKEPREPKKKRAPIHRQLRW